ncbi:mechanosensitive ion channel family protein [Candidatus Saccharibacteria bacterium]|nr:mechanosensitive ion channel family protein [Candidatus Saccharibacteria bacterium]
MDFLEKVVENVWVQRGFWSAVVVLFSLFIYRIITRVLNNKEKKTSKIISNKKNKTIIRMLRSIIAGTLSIVTVLMVLQIYGVNVTSMLAGVGIVGIVVGFALQDSLKDIIRGFVIISDNYYDIGDVIKYDGNVGPVTSISLLTTKIQDINTMDIVSIANRNIDKVEIDPGYIFIQVPLPYELKFAKAEEVMQGIAQNVAKDDLITSCTYQGLTQIASSSLDYQIVAICDPVNRLQARRNALGIVVSTLESHKISIPYNQLDLHNKK